MRVLVTVLALSLVACGGSDAVAPTVAPCTSAMAEVKAARGAPDAVQTTATSADWLYVSVNDGFGIIKHTVYRFEWNTPAAKATASGCLTTVTVEKAPL